MKIIYLITKSQWGGAQKYVYDLAIEAQKRGWETAVVLGGGGELKTALEQAGVKTIFLPLLARDIKIWSDLKTFFALFKLFKQEKPDIIHLNSSKIGGLGSLAGRLAGAPKIIFTGHGWAFNEKRFFLSRWIIGLLHWITILLCHQTIAVSQKTASQLLHFPGVKNKITVIYNGIDTPIFLSKTDARTKLDPASTDTLWLGTIAELHKNKGLDILLVAYKKVLEKIPGLNLIIIGEGEERDNLARLIAKLNLTNNVSLIGRREQAIQYLPAFDLFILPSRTEALPYAVLEAGAAGLPIVASKTGGIPEIVEDDISGLLVTAGNHQELAWAIEKLLTNKNLAQTLSQHLRQKILTDFSKKKMLDQTFAWYQK